MSENVNDAVTIKPPPFCYCIVHIACKNRLGVLGSQIWHAARECMKNAPALNTETVCVLQADSAGELEKLVEVLSFAHVHHIAIREPKAPWNGTITAIGVDAMDDEQRKIVKPLLAHLKLLG